MILELNSWKRKTWISYKKIESLESESLSQFTPAKKTQEPEIVPTPDIEYYITTDKTAYSLGDTIVISGVLDVNHKVVGKKVDGSDQITERNDFTLNVYHTEHNRQYDNYHSSECRRNFLDETVRDVWYESTTLPLKPCPVKIGENGIFEHKIIVTDGYVTGKHTIQIYNVGYSLHITTSFTIQ